MDADPGADPGADGCPSGQAADQGLLGRADAEAYASWFRALSDPTRVVILQLLAVAGRPLSVGEITDRLDVGQSTVSHHLAKLAEVRFVLMEPVGTSTLWRVNGACVDCFPTAADVVMGRTAPGPPTGAPSGTCDDERNS
jgi:DNA-binding transcriptional ArsR family regulator